MRGSLLRREKWRIIPRGFTLVVVLVLPIRAVWAASIGPDAFDYTATDSVPFSFEDITSTGTRVLNGADDSTTTVPIGFTFTFYGQAFTNISFSSNGLVTFGAENRQFANVDLTTMTPDVDVPSVAVFWDDLQFFQVGTDAVYYAATGSAPARRFIIQWNRVGHYSSSPALMTFEVVLFEGSGSVLIQYQDVDTGDANAFGASATVGIRDIGGETNGRHLQWSFDSPVLANGSALLFGTNCGNGTLEAGETCDDGNTTSGDGCNSGCQTEPCYTCSGQPSTCSPLPDGTACDDGLFCNGTDTCSGATCTIHSGTPCPGGTDCTNLCDEPSHMCLPFAPFGTACTDDGNVCTDDECDGMGACMHPDNFNPCDDGVFCNGSDFCEFGGCVFHEGNPCAFNECDTTCDEMVGACDPDAAGTPCSDDGEVCTNDQCDGMGSCAHPPAASGTACPDDGLVCTNDQCDGQGFCAHPPLPGGAPCPGDGNVCTNDECNGIGLCVHPALPDGTACDDADACTQTDRCQSGHCVGSDPVICTAPACRQAGTCDPSTGTCASCPAGYSPGEGGCQKTYAIDASQLDNQFPFCDDANRYNGCGTQPFGFHWTDAGDAGVGEVMRVDVQLETGIDCTNTEHDVTLNSTSIGVYASTAGCFCAPAPSSKLLTDVDTSTYVKGGPNSVSIDSFGCAGLSEDEQGDFALVTTTYENLGAPIAIRTGCRQAAKSTFKYYNRTTDARDKVLWKWRRGAATTQVEFADPTASADYQFCIYAETTGAPALLIGAEVPAGASLWRAVRNVGYQYMDTTASHDGIRQILVKGGTAGRSKIVLRGKGTALSDPTLPRSPATDIRVQLTNASSGVCWESEFPISDLTGGIGGHAP